MQWTPGDRGNVEDMRGRSGVGAIPLSIGGFLVLLMLSWVSGTNLFSLLSNDSQTPSPGAGTSGQVSSSPAEERMVDFVDAVAKDTQDTWAQLLGSRYERTRVVLFRDSIDSACGYAQSATGPFYCPEDRKVYLDLGFFNELSRRFGAPGDFAQAYVIAHEIGHHVQNLLGILPKVQQVQQSLDKVEANQVQVRVELQADCLAGAWAHHSQETWNFIEPGDVEAAMQTASAIGDDRLQRQTQGYVVPDAFTHGSSQQRTRWFMTGLKSGKVESCDTFSAAQL